MHDTVAQSLSAIVLQVETAQDELASGEVAAVGDTLASMGRQARKALDDTRRAVKGLSADVLKRLSPAQAIAEETARFESDSAVPAQFLLTGAEQPISPDQSLALLRIAQEALNNVRKHASPNRVRVGLQYGPDAVAIVVEDDGAGFDPAARESADGGGYGLYGMNERVRLLRGDLLIESVPGWGTRIRASIPYRADREPPAIGREAPPEPAEASRPQIEAPFSPLDMDRQAALLAARSGKPGTAINDRELEVLQLLARGARNKEIAAELFITVSTVEKHIASLFTKLGVSNRTEAVRVAIGKGLVEMQQAT
jgi:DNA-binding CsgD family transcriptional regulator/two-component sensor histidine kinase